MARLLSEIIEEQMDKEIRMSGEELYQLFMEAFYVGANVSRYDPNPNYSRDKGFINTKVFDKLRQQP